MKIAERDVVENWSLDEEISSSLTVANSALRENANCGNYIFDNIGEIWILWNSLKFKYMQLVHIVLQSNKDESNIKNIKNIITVTTYVNY